MAKNPTHGRKNKGMPTQEGSATVETDMSACVGRGYAVAYSLSREVATIPIFLGRHALICSALLLPQKPPLEGDKLSAKAKARLRATAI